MSDNQNSVAASTSGNDSIIGRLLEEVSWEGRSVRRYRDGGRGLENVLTAEVFTALDFLPRRDFLGAVLAKAHGADRTRLLLSREVEEADLIFLPEEVELNPCGQSRGERLIVQPDALISTRSCYALVEAKRIRSNSFQSQQLAREYLAVIREAGSRAPLLFLVLGTAPPVAIRGFGRKPLLDAIALQLPVVHALMGDHPLSLDELTGRIADVCAWITWPELVDTVVEQRDRVVTADSAGASISRLVESVVRSVERHS